METTKDLLKSIFKTKRIIRRAKNTYFIINETSNAALFFFGVYFVNDLISRTEKYSATEVITAVAIIAIIELMYVISRVEWKLMKNICKDMEKALEKQENNNI
jgi:hypothetical protein